MYKKLIYLPIIALIILLFSCNKTIITYDGILEFSNDTIMFDTVFTTQGSSMRTLKVYNNTDEHMIITYIAVANGQQSRYNINVNGISGHTFENVEIEPHDSIYIFAQVRIDPNNLNSPLIVEDSICFRMENNVQHVKLLAWGQDANYIIADTHVSGLPSYKIVAKENETTVWDSPKPYVVFGYAVVDSTGQLIINAGTRVHFHSNGGLWVYKGGSIKVYGTADNKVVFEGDRLEPAYDTIPGQWEKIWINEGTIDNEFHHAIIKNSLVGIHTQTLGEPMENSLILNNVEITNTSSVGIYSMFYKIYAGNTVVSSSAGQLAYLSMGGIYDFRNCTFANYYSGNRDVSSVYLSNFYTQNGVDFAFGEMDAYFGNCIVYGNRLTEINMGKHPTVAYECNFDHSLVKIQDSDFNKISEYFTNCVRNEDPMFKNNAKRDYRLDSIASPAINKGSISVVDSSYYINITRDFSGNSRTNDDAPDIGAFEYIDIP